MKILHVLDHSIPLHSGYTFRTRAILREQAARGWETALEEVVDGLRFYRTPRRTGRLFGLPLLGQWEVVSGLTRRLDEVIARERPDILHAHSPSLDGAAAIAAGRRHRLPVVYECRLRRDIVARGIPAEKVTVIPNAVDIEAFSLERKADAELAARLGLAGRPVIGFIGSFYAYEGLALALDALALLRLLLVGGGPQGSVLEEKVARLGLAEAVVFTGRVPHAEVARYYDLVDVFVYPRLSMRLTDLVTPLKPLEAMAQGRLVVASDVGGHRELIRDGETGVLFPAGDAAALARAVESLFAGRDRWPALQAAGRRFVEGERNWRASVARYEAVYAGAVAARRR